MGILSLLIFGLNTAIILGVVVLMGCHSLYMAAFGLLGIAAYFLAYALSVEATLSRRDFWANPALKITWCKLKFANCAAFLTWFLSMVIALLCGNEHVDDFCHWLSN